MRILFIEWKSLGQIDITAEFKRRGYIVDFYSFPRETENTRLNMELGEKLIRTIAGKNYDFIFSFNYFPVVAIASNACMVKYVSWTFDSPFIQLYSNTIFFPYNYIFVFDKAVCLDLWAHGANSVYYLPMAAPVERYDGYIINDELRKFYGTQLSFIGSTYSEQKNCFYERLSGLKEYTKGYLDGCIQVQKKVYGKFILESMLTPEIMEDLQRVCPTVVNQDGFERLAWVYAHYFLARHVTALERQEILGLLSERFHVDFYTYEQTPRLPKVNNRGTAEVMQEGPVIYKCSKINLNVSLKSIISGIPLRAFDIMGCGGFLLSNYQEDFLEYFIPGQDYVYYEDYDDLLNKADYYLVHEKEREEIARNGYEKVKKYHTYKERVDTILEVTNYK
ncbi:spore maturation protein CgeB [Kineothrix alysoides]|uniref:Spore maturation protein CgeB n=1 Tax=Kineothrix alysoides TaxID=1469948 RepID=A0A4R1QT43_9FIRM|nr:spore maturation protein CgeB [Kineothrix alysoides]